MMVPGVVLLNETPVGNGNRDADLLFKPDLATEQRLTMMEERKFARATLGQVDHDKGTDWGWSCLPLRVFRPSASELKANRAVFDISTNVHVRVRHGSDAEVVEALFIIKLIVVGEEHVLVFRCTTSKEAITIEGERQSRWDRECAVLCMLNLTLEASLA